MIDWPGGTTGADNDGSLGATHQCLLRAFQLATRPQEGHRNYNFTYI